MKECHKVTEVDSSTGKIRLAQNAFTVKKGALSHGLRVVLTLVFCHVTLENALLVSRCLE